MPVSIFRKVVLERPGVPSAPEASLHILTVLTNLGAGRLRGEKAGRRTRFPRSARITRHVHLFEPYLLEPYLRLATGPVRSLDSLRLLEGGRIVPLQPRGVVFTPRSLIFTSCPATWPTSEYNTLNSKARPVAHTPYITYHTATLLFRALSLSTCLAGTSEVVYPVNPTAAKLLQLPPPGLSPLPLTYRRWETCLLRQIPPQNLAGSVYPIPSIAQIVERS